MHSTTRDDHRARISRVTSHLERHLDEDLDVPGLARVACLSEFHFHRVFRAVVGESVMSHVRRLRLERAARALVLAPQPVHEVAIAAGFQSHEAFTRAFVAHFGVPPREWRSEHKVELAPAPAEAFARLERWPEQQLLCLRHVGAYQEVGETWARLHALAHEQGLAGPGLGLCHDDPEVTEPSRFRYDACLVLPEGRAGTRLPGGTFAVTSHQGPYEALPETYGQLVRWALLRGLALDEGPSVERYQGEGQTAVALRVSP